MPLFDAVVICSTFLFGWLLVLWLGERTAFPEGVIQAAGIAFGIFMVWFWAIEEAPPPSPVEAAEISFER